MKTPGAVCWTATPRWMGLLWVLTGWLASCVASAGQEVHVKEDFSKGADRWKPTDAAAWSIVEVEGNPAYALIKKKSAYEPAHRSPHNISLLEDVAVGDFVLTARVRTTEESYGHRSMCLFFGYQDPTHFYYVHFGQEADDHANQVFLVRDAPRIKISTKTTEGTPWKDGEWHRVRVERRVESGLIRVFFDDMETPVMEAEDRSFLWGKIGLGSFDDRGMWDDVEVQGQRVREEDAGKKAEQGSEDRE
ncbi:MAG TPA: hypothetical protein VMN36_15105 [Verrucomicrobiales bacterium]|nr:hypothetical protein [Verrucomicrobiales bacterium]